MTKSVMSSHSLVVLQPLSPKQDQWSISSETSSTTLSKALLFVGGDSGNSAACLYPGVRSNGKSTFRGPWNPDGKKGIRAFQV